MASLPRKYSYAGASGTPSLIREAVKLYGILEVPGKGDNPVIIAWAKEVEKGIGVAHLGYSADSIPWCGLFTAIVAVRAGWGEFVPKTPLWAKSWANFGVKADVASLGDILVFSRPGGGGHVGFYIGEDKDFYHVLGGNQSNAVTITRITKSRCIAVRRPKWRIAQPTSVRPIHVGASGPVSINEA